MILYRPKTLDGKGSRDASPKSLSKKSISSATVGTGTIRSRIETEEAAAVDGKTPIEASLMVMKMISDAVGVNSSAVGHSTSDRLKSLRTEPALKLLGNTTWRNFFNAEPSTGKFNKKSNNFNATGFSTSYDQNQYLVDNLNKIFYDLVERVETLWRQLKVPDSDVQFYRENLCKGPPDSLQHCRAVAKYIQVLKRHKVQITTVLKAIQEREECVATFYDVLVALNRKVNHRKISEQQQHQHPSQQQQQLQDLYFWKQELVEALRDVQFSTVVVVKAIHHWRKGLWRPQQFIWRNFDYVEKIKSDMAILNSPMHLRHLESIGLRQEDLICILFTKNNNVNSNNTSSKMNHHSSDYGDTSSAKANKNRPLGGSQSLPGLTVNITPYGESPTSYSSTGSAGGIPASQAKFREYFFSSSLSSKELLWAEKVVLDDEMLQSAIQTERATLLEKGVFIPTLKLEQSSGVQGVTGTAGGNPNPNPSQNPNNTTVNAGTVSSSRHGTRPSSARPQTHNKNTTNRGSHDSFD